MCTVIIPLLYMNVSRTRDLPAFPPLHDVPAVIAALLGSHDLAVEVRLRHDEFTARVHAVVVHSATLNTWSQTFCSGSNPRPGWIVSHTCTNSVRDSQRSEERRVGKE